MTDDVEQGEHSAVGRSKRQYKVFNDPIHGHMEFHPLIVAIIDTPQFQRLRYIKQLGGGYFVFPGASHNRFEHSLGVCHLAGLMMRKLQEDLQFDDIFELKKEGLEITEEDILCVEIAGLCHDLGHGPFSHTFDNRSLPMYELLPHHSSGKEWKHEIGSVDMFDHMIEVNENVKSEMGKYKLNKKERDLIKELISGDGELAKGKKKFLFEIVANKSSGIDVDKWDYFARDCKQLGIPNNFDHKRLMHFAKIVKVEIKDKDGVVKEVNYHIAYRDKQVSEVYDMFHTRNSLHRRALQHKNKVIVEYMLSEALSKANNEHLTFPVKEDDGNVIRLKLSDTINDMRAYTHVNDSVYHRILYSEDTNLDGARQILENLEKRQLYVCVGQTTKKQPVSLHHLILHSEDPKLEEARQILENLKKHGLYICFGKPTENQPVSPLYDLILHSKDPMLEEARQILENREKRQLYICVDQPTKKQLDLDENDTKDELENFIKSKDRTPGNKFQTDDFIILFTTYDYGKDGEDPVRNVRFYNKAGKPDWFGPGEFSKLIPDVFSEKYVRLYSRSRERKDVEQLKRCFKKFCSEEGYREPKGGDQSTQPLEGAN